MDNKLMRVSAVESDDWVANDVLWKNNSAIRYRSTTLVLDEQMNFLKGFFNLENWSLKILPKTNNR